MSALQECTCVASISTFSIHKTTAKVDFGTPNNYYWDVEWLAFWVCPFFGLRLRQF